MAHSWLSHVLTQYSRRQGYIIFQIQLLVVGIKYFYFTLSMQLRLDLPAFVLPKDLR